jgi:hypothetical protein
MFKLRKVCLCLAKLVFTVFFLLCYSGAFAKSAEKEPTALLEVGPAAGRSLTEGQSSFGPTVAVEVTPVEKWLEREAGVTLLFGITQLSGQRSAVLDALR